MAAMITRRRVFTAWAAVLVVAFGVGAFGLTTLVIGWFEDREGVAGPVTDLGYGALVGLIVTVGIAVQLRSPERKIAGLQQAFLAVPALVAGSALAADAQNLVPAAILVPTLGILLALHPARSEFVERPAAVSRPLLVISALAAVPLTAYALEMGADARDLAGPPHHVQRLSTMAALGVAIALVCFLAALRTHGWRIPAWSAGAAAAVLGLAPVRFPNDPGAVGQAWGGLVLAGGFLFIGVAEWEARHPVSSAELRGKDGSTREGGLS